MWSEWTPTNKDVERQTFPRIAAYAETGWTKKDNKDYTRFRKSMDNLILVWDGLNISYGPLDTKKQSTTVYTNMEIIDDIRKM